jgi:inorganic pyrophosphatase
MGEIAAMDTEKWKSVIVPKEVYDEIKVISHVEGRTISGQLRWMFEVYKDAKSKDPIKTVG